METRQGFTKATTHPKDEHVLIDVQHLNHLQIKARWTYKENFTCGTDFP